MVIGAEHVDLLDGNGIEEAFDYAENTGKSPGSIDEV